CVGIALPLNITVERRTKFNPFTVTVAVAVGPCVTMEGAIVLIAGSGDAGGSGTGAVPSPSAPGPPPRAGRAFSRATTHGNASTAGVKSAPSPGGLKVVW